MTKRETAAQRNSTQTEEQIISILWKLLQRGKKKGKNKKQPSDLFLQQICEYQYDEF